MEQERRRSSRQLVQRSRSEIYKILQDFERQKGKMTTSEFCSSRGVASGSFYAWRRDEELHGKYSKSSKFVEIQPRDPSSLDSAEAVVPMGLPSIFATIRSGDLALEIHGQVDSGYLRKLLIG